MKLGKRMPVGWKILHIIAWYVSGDTVSMDLVKYLLEDLKPDPNMLNKQGQSALHICAVKGLIYIYIVVTVTRKS
jgi:ankyrin repeat protein